MQKGDRGGGKGGSELKGERERDGGRRGDRQNTEREGRGGEGGGEETGRDGVVGVEGVTGTDSFPFRNLSSQCLILKQFLCCKSHSLRSTGPRLACDTIRSLACTVMLKVWTVSVVERICRQARVKHDTCRGQVLLNALHDRFPFCCCLFFFRW